MHASELQQGDETSQTVHDKERIMHGKLPFIDLYSESRSTYNIDTLLTHKSVSHVYVDNIQNHLYIFLELK